eukprot:gene5368-6039_t
MKHTNSISKYIAFFTILTGLVVRNANGNAELLEKLLENYNVNERPVHNYHDSIPVQVNVGLKQLIRLDEKKQVLVWNGWIKQWWKDIYLTWNVTKENGIKSIVVNKRDIWTPDLAVYNNAQVGFQLISDQSEEYIVVDSTGQCIWMTTLILKTTCILQMANFPFDKQSCEFEMGSWAYTGDKLNISYKALTGNVVGTVTVNGVWELQAVQARLKIGYYSCCVEPYPSVIYKLSLRRRSTYYILNFFLPSCLISLMASVSFFLPETSGERVGLLITNLLSLAFFLMIVSNIVPPTSTVTPLLEVYLTAIFLEICMALVARSFIDKTKRRFKKPGRITTLFINKYLANLLRVRPIRNETENCLAIQSQPSIEPDKLELQFLPNDSQTDIQNHIKEDSKDSFSQHDSEEISCSEVETKHIVNTLTTATTRHNILSTLQNITESVEEESKARADQHALDYFLLNLDEFFFWLFTISLCLSLLIFFLMPPYFELN